MGTARLSPALLAGLLLSGCAKLPQPVRPTARGPLPPEVVAELWEDGDVATRDLFYGPGGRDLQPRPGSRFRFVARKTGGYSPGWDVVGPDGLEWSAKAGPEAQSEVAASRILWAAGYHQPPTYYVADWTLEGTRDTAAPARFRPKLPGWRRTGSWKWHRNPYVGTREMNGLLVLMRMVNNWDLLDRNTATYVVDEGSRTRTLHVVQDLGASFGRTHVLSLEPGTRNDVDEFERQGFIDGVDERGRVRFDDVGRWHRELFRGIPAADARWVCGRLARLEDAQWSAVFAAAGYEEPVARRFVSRMKQRVGECLARTPAVPAIGE